MGANSKIEWTHHTANTWWGCTKVSDGCKHCYAETFSKRTGHDVWGPNASRRMMKGIWSEVVKWAKDAAASGERRRVFWGSMMDVCEDRPELVEPRKRFCGLVEQLEDLDFLILTKRPENYNRLMPWTVWPKNAWAGTSTENQAMADLRCPRLLTVQAAVRWLSVEPMLGPIVFDGGMLHGVKPWSDTDPGIGWMIVGGESGVAARPFNVAWAQAIIDTCKQHNIACFVKQLGAVPVDNNGYEFHLKNPKHLLRKLSLVFKDPKGGNWDEWPEDLRVREFPATVARP